MSMCLISSTLSILYSKRKHSLTQTQFKRTTTLDSVNYTRRVCTLLINRKWFVETFTHAHTTHIDLYLEDSYLCYVTTSLSALVISQARNEKRWYKIKRDEATASKKFQISACHSVNTFNGVDIVGSIKIQDKILVALVICKMRKGWGPIELVKNKHSSNKTNKTFFADKYI